MNYLYFFLFTCLLVSTNTLHAQISMGFENLTTGQNCTNVNCNYRDMGNALVAHDLNNDIARNIPVNSPSSGSILGFTASFRPTRTGVSATDGLTDGDFFGYAGAATIQNNVSQLPTEGSQAFIMEDTDGEAKLTFDEVDLTGTVNPVLTLDFIVDGGFEDSNGSNDRVYIGLVVTGCSAATTVSLFDSDGGGSGGGSAGGGDLDNATLNGSPVLDDVWNTVTANLNTYVGCRVQLVVEVDFDSSTEEFALDNINFSAGVVLPVEFASITASQQKEFVVVEWATETETENRGFALERSMDGRSFSQIGWVAGAGEARYRIDYAFTDKNVIAGQNYFYRLRQEDFDDTFSYSEVVRIEVAGNMDDGITGQFFPNPTVDGQSKVELRTPEAGIWTISVISTNGRKLLETSRELAEGYNLLSINLQSHPAGTYLVQLVNGQRIINRQVVKR